jgi:hypothetical protein
MTRLLSSVKTKRAQLFDPRTTTKEDIARTLVTSGYSIVPYVGIDGGKRFKEEKIENKGQSVTVPSFPILRTYIGFDGALEFALGRVPMKLGVGERIWYLSRPETAAFKTVTGVGNRKIEGIHNRASASWDVFLTQTRNYSFSLKYENGRDAPSFEYLNKVSAGFKIVY